MDLSKDPDTIAAMHLTVAKADSAIRIMRRSNTRGPDRLRMSRASFLTLTRYLQISDSDAEAEHGTALLGVRVVVDDNMRDNVWAESVLG